ncbi:MAG: hypothetical protein ACR2NH_02550 [Solirubrobacteraceae bacterium]
MVVVDDGVLYLHGRGPRLARVSARVTRCPAARSVRRVDVVIGTSERFVRRLGTARRLAGCRIKASLV